MHELPVLVPQYTVHCTVCSLLKPHLEKIAWFGLENITLCGLVLAVEEKVLSRLLLPCIAEKSSLPVVTPV